MTLVGGAATWSLAARAQQAGKNPTVGILWHAGNAQEEGLIFSAMIEGFKALGYVDGKNIKSNTDFPMKCPNDLPAWPPSSWH